MPVRHSLQGIHFEWDAAKAEANRRNHGVEFETACEVFFDPFLRVVDAGDEGPEPREAILGLTTRWQHLCSVERARPSRILVG